MVQLSIDQSVGKGLKGLLLLQSCISGAFSVGILVYYVVLSNYSYVFFCSLLVFILSLVVFIRFILWKSDVLLLVRSREIEIYEPKKEAISVLWENVNEVKIGISSFEFLCKNDISYSVDLDLAKYSDIKVVKLYVLELCQSKNILFSNS